MPKRQWVFARAIVLTVSALCLAGCSGDPSKPSLNAAPAVGQGEGALSLVTWEGFAERGGSDPRVDWVEPFAKRTGCAVSIKNVKSVREMKELMSAPERRYDVVSAPPDISGQLIAERQVAPVNPRLVDGYPSIDPDLRSQLGRDGKVFGVPYVWGTNILLYDTKAVTPAPASWSAVFDPGETRKYSGRITMRNSPFTLAEAAIYLRSRDRSLDIENPFSLTRKQLDAAAKVIKRQRPAVTEYWEHPSAGIEAFTSGKAVIGQGWPYHADTLGRSRRPVAGVAPREGVTGWMDAWMIGARAEHPNCAYQWLSWANSPSVQRQVAEWTGMAPVNPGACGRGLLRPEFCRANHVGERAYIDKVAFARTADCGTSERDTCTTYDDWARAWLAAMT